MTSSDAKGCQEIEELLGAYALDALGQGEAGLVEAHLSSCSRCRQSLVELHRVTALLGEAVSQQVPSAAVHARLMVGLDRVQREAMPAGRSQTSRRQSRVASLMVPLAASLAVILFASSVLTVFHLSRNVGRLERENLVLNARVAQLVAEETYLLDRLHQIRVTNYLMAAPDTEAVPLEVSGGNGGSQGLLLVSGDGRRAILMVAGMDQSSAPPVYQVWLVRGGQPVSAGEVAVDSSGWGTMVLHPPESVFGFEWVGLTAEGTPGSALSSGDMILRGRITSKKSIK